MDFNNKRDVNRLFFYALISTALLMTLGWILVKYSDSFWPIVFLIIIVLLSPALPFKRSFKPINFCVALIILVHLILAPFIYVWALQRDSTSFLIDQQILKNEQKFYLESAVDDLKNENIDSLMGMINLVLSSKDNQLNLPTNYLNNNLIKIDTFTFAYVYSDLGMGWLKVFNQTGKKIFDLGGVKGGKGMIGGIDMFLRPSKEYAFKEYLLKYRSFLISSEKIFKTKQENIINKRIWTYANVLPYVLDVYDTANFKPISRTAQIIHTCHVIIVFLLLFGILMSFIFAEVTKRIYPTKT